MIIYLALVSTYLKGQYRLGQVSVYLVFKCHMKMLTYCPLVCDTKIPYWNAENTWKKDMFNYVSHSLAMTLNVLDRDEGSLDEVRYKCRKGLRESQELGRLSLLQSDELIQRRRAFKICYSKKKIHSVLVKIASVSWHGEFFKNASRL